MIHKMRLREEEFENIRSNGKIIEIRLNDEKRKKIKAGDKIIFYKNPMLKESVLVQVTEIRVFQTFEEAYAKFPCADFGYQNTNIIEMVNNIYTIYDKEKEKNMESC